MLVTFVIAAAIADVIVRAFRLPRTLESWGVSTLAGYCLLSAVALCVGSYSIIVAGMATRLLAAAALAYCLVRARKRVRSSLTWLRRMPTGPLAKTSAAAVLVSLACGLVAIHAPVTSWDAGVAHLALPAAYAREGRITVIPSNNYSAYPQLMHALFSVVPAGSRESGSAGITWSFGALLCATAYWLAKRIGGANCGFPAAGIVATTPLFLEQSAIPGIDVPYTATVLGALCAMAAWRQDKRAGWQVLAAVLAGSGCGIRHTAYLVNALLFAGVALLAERNRWRSCAVFAAIVCASAAPWLIRTAMMTGNPVYPFFSSILGAGSAPDVDVAAIGAHSSLQGRGLLQLLAFPWSLTMNPARYGGWSTSPGALWLVLGVLGVILGGPGARALGAFSGVGLVAMFFFQRFARYAFPFLAPMMVLAALPIDQLPRLRRVTFAAIVVSYAFGLGPALMGTAIKFPVVLGIESRDDYLTKRIERYPAMAWVAGNLPRDATLLSLDPRGYYFNRTTITNFEALKAIAPYDPERQREWLRDNGIDYVFYPNAYVNESPAFRETGVGVMIDAWRADAAHFTLIKDFDLPNPRSGRSERVAIYEFQP